MIRSALQTPSRPLSHCSPESSKSNVRRCAEWPAISSDCGCKEVVFQPWPRRRANNELTYGAVTGRESGSGRLRCAEQPAISSGCAAMASHAAPKTSHFSSSLSCAERPAPATATHAFDCSTMGLGSGFAGFTSSVGWRQTGRMSVPSKVLASSAFPSDPENEQRGCPSQYKICVACG